MARCSAGGGGEEGGASLSRRQLAAAAAAAAAAADPQRAQAARRRHLHPLPGRHACRPPREQRARFCRRRGATYPSTTTLRCSSSDSSASGGEANSPMLSWLLEEMEPCWLMPAATSCSGMVAGRGDRGEVAVAGRRGDGLNGDSSRCSLPSSQPPLLFTVAVARMSRCCQRAGPCT